jgi:hypothetical protein
MHRLAGPGQHREQQRRRRVDDVDRPDQLGGQRTRPSQERDDLCLIVGDLDRQQRLSVGAHHARPMVRLADIDADPGRVCSWGHSRVSVRHLEVLTTARGTPRRRIRNQRPSADLNQQPGRPGGPGGHSQLATTAQGDLSHTRPSWTAHSLTEAI